MNKTLQDNLNMMRRHADEMEDLLVRESLQEHLPLYHIAFSREDLVKEIWNSAYRDEYTHVYKLNGKVLCKIKHRFVVGEDNLAKIVVEKI